MANSEGVSKLRASQSAYRAAGSAGAASSPEHVEADAYSKGFAMPAGVKHGRLSEQPEGVSPDAPMDDDEGDGKSD